MSEGEQIDEDSVVLEVAGQKVIGTLLKPEAPVPGFLFIHGWGGSQEEDLGHAEELARLGCICFTFDLRGHAGSDRAKDQVTRQDSLEDVLAAYDYLASQPLVDSSAIGVVGTSYGGYLATLLTGLRPIRWLGLRVPALYPDDGWETPKAKLDKTQVSDYRSRPQTGAHDRALSACEQYRGDVLIVESEHDEHIPHEAIVSFQSAFRTTNSLSHRIIRGATHAMRDPTHQRIYSALLTRWIEEMVRASRLSYR